MVALVVTEAPEEVVPREREVMPVVLGVLVETETQVEQCTSEDWLVRVTATFQHQNLSVGLLP
jgi:hypothetical protein